VYVHVHVVRSDLIIVHDEGCVGVAGGLRQRISLFAAHWSSADELADKNHFKSSNFASAKAFTIPPTPFSAYPHFQPVRQLQL